MEPSPWQRVADWRWGERLGNDFEGNKNMFLKEVKRVRTGEQARDEMGKDVNGKILRDGVEARRRLAQYCEQVLNVGVVREANIVTWQLADASVGIFE